jgi:hypothetical protein
VSEVKDWILPDSVHNMTEMEQGLQQMMELLLASHAEKINAHAKAHQDKVDAKVGTH